MSATHATRGLRPRGLSAETQARLDKILGVKAQRDRIARIREALANIVDSLEREAEARRIASVGAGGPSRLLTEALCAAADFEMLVAEDIK